MALGQLLLANVRQLRRRVSIFGSFFLRTPVVRELLVERGPVYLSRPAVLGQAETHEQLRTTSVPPTISQQRNSTNTSDDHKKRTACHAKGAPLSARHAPQPAVVHRAQAVPK